MNVTEPQLKLVPTPVEGMWKGCIVNEIWHPHCLVFPQSTLALALECCGGSNCVFFIYMKKKL